MAEEYCYSEKFLIYAIKVMERLSQYITDWKTIGECKGITFYLDLKKELRITLTNNRNGRVSGVLRYKNTYAEVILWNDKDLDFLIAMTKGVIEEWERI